MSENNNPDSWLDQTHVHFQQAIDYKEAGLLAAALHECDAALHIDSIMSEAHNLRGVILQELGHLNEAIKSYEKAIQFEPSFEEAVTNLAEAYNMRGVILEEMGRIPEAIKAYKQAILYEPGLYEAKDNLNKLIVTYKDRQFYQDGRELITIATFLYPNEAYIQKAKLEAGGVLSFVADDYVSTMNWLYTTAIDGVKLQVEISDIERALEILDRKADINDICEEANDTSNDETRCPECESINLNYYTFEPRLVFLSWVLILILAFTFIVATQSFALPFIKRKWKCGDCGYSWKSDQRKSTE